MLKFLWIKLIFDISSSLYRMQTETSPAVHIRMFVVCFESAVFVFRFIDSRLLCFSRVVKLLS